MREGEDLIMQENEQDTTHIGTLSRNKTQKDQELTTESSRSATMQWSPVKLAGNKRTLDAVGEADDSLEESEEEREDGEINDEGINANCYPSPEVNAAGTNTLEAKTILAEPNESEEQLEGRLNEQMPSSHEVHEVHSVNTGSDDLMRQGDGQTVEGSQGGAELLPNTGEPPALTETTLHRSPKDTCRRNIGSTG